MRKLVKLTEGDLHRIVENSVRQVMEERSAQPLNRIRNKEQLFYQLSMDEKLPRYPYKEIGKVEKDLEDYQYACQKEIDKYREWWEEDIVDYVDNNYGVHLTSDDLEKLLEYFWTPTSTKLNIDNSREFSGFSTDGRRAF